MDQHPPPITDYMGRYWDQPAREDVLVDDCCAVMTAATRAELANYEASNPSGVYTGKMWRRGDLLVWYGDSGDPSKCTINTREIVIV